MMVIPRTGTVDVEPAVAAASRRLLVIPHVYAEDVLVRSIEFARRLRPFFGDVYCLKWQDPVHVDECGFFARRWKQLHCSLDSLLRIGTATSKGTDGIVYVRARLLEPLLLRRLIGMPKAMALSRAFNGRVLGRLIKTLGVTHLLLASDRFGIPSRQGVRIIYDVVDWVSEETMPAGDLRGVVSHLKETAGKTDSIVAVSDSLSEKLEKDYGVRTIPVPNGADVSRLRNVPASAVEAVRRRWGLGEKYVVGYIGNHGSYSGVDLVVNAFDLLKREMPEAVLMIVGPAGSWSRLMSQKRENVIFTGPVPTREIAAYFRALDAGVLAQEDSSGTRYAFQLKIVEYTACRQHVISTPLLACQRLGWPNIHFIERRPEAWAEAVMKLKTAPWKQEWDALVEPYDWRRLADRLGCCLVGGLS